MSDTLRILDKIGLVAYRIALPLTLSGVHNVLYVSMLRNYVLNPMYINDYELL